MNSTTIFQNLPESLKVFCGLIQQALPNIIPDVLVGIYIYGSISYDAFSIDRSDVDIVAIIKRKLSQEEIGKLANWYQGTSMQSSEWLERLEMDYVTLADVTTNISNNPKTTRFAGGTIREQASFDGAVIDWENIRACGMTLYGESPKLFIPEISKKLLFEALIDKFVHLKQNIPQWMTIDLWNQVFIIVQLCRVVYALENDGKPVSKQQAAQWCAENSPFQFREMILFVLDNIGAGDEPIVEIVSGKMPAFITYIDSLFSRKKYQK